MMPVSLRTEESERLYQLEKMKGTLRPLRKETAVCEFQYWRVVENRFPYDVCFKTHHLLIPIREARHRNDLNRQEKEELEEIIQVFIEPYYDVMFDNMQSKRSINNHYHIHLAVYHDNRADMKL